MNKYKYLGEGALILTTLIWGGTFPIIKNALNDISPMLFITLRFSLASLIVFPFIYKILKRTPREALVGGFFLGLIYFFGFASQTAGLKFTSATKSGFITGTFILFVPLFQLLIEKRAPGKGSIIGIIFVLAGLIFLSSKGTSFLTVFSELGDNFNTGDFLTFLCAFFFAWYVVYLDVVSKKFNYIPLVFMQLVVTALGSAVFMIFFSLTDIESPKIIFNEAVITALVYTFLLATIVTTTLQTKFQKVVSPAKAGIILSCEPIFAAVFAFFMLQEKITNFGLIGCALIFCGLVATEIIDKKENAYG